MIHLNAVAAKRHINTAIRRWARPSVSSSLKTAKGRKDRCLRMPDVSPSQEKTFFSGQSHACRL